MSTIVTRAGKGSALTWTEGDANITNLNNDKIELTNLSVGAEGTASGDGSISYNNTTGVFTYTPPVIPAAFDPASPGAIGGTTPAAGSFTTLSANAGLSVQSGSLLSKLNVNIGGITLGYNTAGAFSPRLTLPAGASGAMDTVNIGAVNPGTGAFTTLSASTSVSMSPSGAITLNPTTAGTINNMSIGATTAATGRFTTLVLSAQSITAITTETNGDLQIIPNGTGTTFTKNLRYYENVFALGTTSGTIAPNATNGNVQTITLNGNLTINAFTGPISGQTITLVITTGGTGRTLTSTMLFAGGSKTLSTTSTVDILTISYIGTTYYASLVKGYA